MEWSPEFVLLVELVFVELELIRRATQDLCEAGGLDDLRQVLGGLFARMGIDQYAFIYVDGLVLGKGTPVIVSNFDTCWQALYREHRYQCIDPFMRRARRCALPFHWSEVSVGPFGCEADATFLACARRHRIDTRRGAAIPAHARGEQLSTLSFCQFPDNRYGREIHIRDAYLLSGVATTLHQLVGQLAAGCHRESLTVRERECLLWASRGKSQEEVAMILGIAARTVRFHHENAMRKLDAGNIAGAVALATALGHI